MKRGIILLFAFLLIAYTGMGQQLQPSSTSSRLIAVRTEIWDGNAWMNNDSTSFTYSGNRGTFYNYFDSIDFNSKRYQLWDWQNEVWHDSLLTEKTYDAQNNVLSHAYRSWNGSAWVYIFQQQYTYDANNNQLSKTNLEPDSLGNLQNKGRKVYTYDSNNNIMSLNTYSWANGTWEPEIRELYTYSASNKQTSRLTQRYDTVYYDRFKYLTTYNLNDDIEEYSFWSFNNGNWGNIDRTIYTYDANNRLITKKDQNLPPNWRDKKIETYTYNAEGLVSHLLIEQQFSHDPIAPTHQHGYVYDTAGRLTEHTHQQYLQNGWSNWRKYNHTYDAAGNELVYLMYSHYNGLWEESNRFTTIYNTFNQPLNTVKLYSGQNYYNLYYYYKLYDDESTGFSSVPTIHSSTQPNPFKTNVAVNLELTQSGHYTFEVYNMAGQRIYTQTDYRPAGTHTFVWEGRDDAGNPISSGMHFYRIGNGNEVATGKLVKE